AARRTGPRSDLYGKKLVNRAREGERWTASQNRDGIPKPVEARRTSAKPDGTGSRSARPRTSGSGRGRPIERDTRAVTAIWEVGGSSRNGSPDTEPCVVKRSVPDSATPWGCTGRGDLTRWSARR